MYWKILQVCYNLSREVMKKVKIKIYSFLNNIEENNEFLAIKDDNVIKYIDFSNNQMIIHLKENYIEKENDDYLFTLKFNENVIEIFSKKLKKTFYKEIKTIVCESSKTKFLVRYLLTDENIVNEYYVKF